MSRLRVAPIVEGHGEFEAIRLLLTRIWTELLGGEYIDVLRPIRWPRSKLMQRSGLCAAVELAAAKLGLKRESGDPLLVLVLVDADDDLPCVKGPELTEWAGQVVGNIDIACVLANVEYETWFVAAATSLGKYLMVPPAEQIPDAPEASRAGKRWIERYVRGGQYSETLEQPRMTATMDLSLAREKCPSFDKLCRELKRCITPAADHTEDGADDTRTR